MYLVSEALRITQKSGTPKFSAADVEVLKNYKKHIDMATRFIPGWVKVAVALATLPWGIAAALRQAGE